MSEPRKKQRLPITAHIRFRVFERDKFKCVYCGMPGTHCILEVDHIVPVSRGGTNEMFNLATSCADCNVGKSSRVIALNDLPDVVHGRQLEADFAHRKSVATMVAARLFTPPLPAEAVWLNKLMNHAYALGFDEMAAFVDLTLSISNLTNEQRLATLDEHLISFIGGIDGNEIMEITEDAI